MIYFEEYKEESFMNATIVLEFNRDISYGKDFISPGSFTIITKEGKRKQFDFIKASHGRYINKPNCTKIDLYGVDPDYQDGADVTITDIMKLDKFEEIFINISDKDDLEFVAIDSFSFEGKTRSGKWIYYKLTEDQLKQANQEVYLQYEK